MARLRKLVAVTLVVTLAAAFAVYLARPTGPATSTVVINEPDTPDTPDAGDDGDTPTTTEPPAHGFAAQNSNGPKSAVCLPANSHVPDQAADEGANRYRGTCATFAGRGPR
jgi:hypothetical protein